jgi:hypothetical protein
MTTGKDDDADLGREEKKRDETEPDAPVTDEELALASALRDALDDPSRSHPGAELARAVVLAHSPRPIDPAENEALVRRALETRAPVVSLDVARRRSRPAVWGVVSAFAIAASVLLARSQPSSSVASSTVIRSRSTEGLFHEPFAARGGTSSRIDRIASARAADLRENMFARWDVR